MEQSIDTLREFAETFCEPGRDLETLSGPVMFYGLFLRKILNNHDSDFTRQKDAEESTITETGAALVPWDAAACMEDRIRTAAFIRGAIHAVEHKLRQTDRRPLHLVEAGCGPLGTLLLPLLAKFSAGELVISAIDLHEQSIACTTAMLDYFGFLPRARQLVHGDATAINLESPVDLIVTETMNTALTSEPQVAISRALLRKNPAASLVPQSIKIDLALVDLAEESSHFPPRVCDRVFLGHVFELSASSALQSPEQSTHLPANTITLPSGAPPTSHLCLITTIQVFEGTTISDYDSQISPPFPIADEGPRPIPPGSTLQFSYRITENPGIVWQHIG